MQPWPIISAVTRYIDQRSDDSAQPSRPAVPFPAGNATAPAAADDVADRTAETVSTAASATARFVRRQLDENPIFSNESDSSGWRGDDEYQGGTNSWSEPWSSSVRWAAIAIILGILVAIWVPWIFISIRVSPMLTVCFGRVDINRDQNNRAVVNLIESWNDHDENQGYMRSLSWTLNKAPAISNSKLLVINLPPGMQQQASIFHINAYPPSYGFAPYPHHGGLPGYGPGVDPYAGAYPDVEKGEWMHPPASLYGPPITRDSKITEVEERSDSLPDGAKGRPGDALSVIEEQDEPGQTPDPETLPVTSPKSLLERVSIQRASQTAYVERDDPDAPGRKKRFSLNEARLSDSSGRRSKVDGMGKNEVYV